ncbi:hematopoietic death receptor isoform 1-T1 [Symphorus nematophorus]
MTTLIHSVVFSVSVLIWLFIPTGAFPRSTADSRANRTRRNIECRDDQEYPNGNICCLNCPAGTRLTSPCTTAGGKGRCEECNDGTYTEHSNSLKHCFECTRCRLDQEIVRRCTHTQDTECQCKAGRFCVDDQACEVCKKCTRCEKDEVTVRNCTSNANTVCKKIQTPSGSTSVVAVIVSLSLVAGLIGLITGVYLWKRCRAAGSQGGRVDEPKAAPSYSGCPTEESRNAEPRLSLSGLIPSRQLVRAKSPTRKEDERRVLCESLSSSASNSQHSLTGLQYYAFPVSLPQAYPVVLQQANRREDEPFPELFPVNGEESLKKCFEYFEEMDITFHKRFFRNLDVSDNEIKSLEHLHYDDRIHELLKIWVEKEGIKASLNDLLKALLDLNQRRTAEIIMDRAIKNGHYFIKE